MVIKRDLYLDKLKKAMHNGRIKIITGIRRCGKSFLLFNLFKEHLLSEGVAQEQIIEIALDRQEFVGLRNPVALYEYVKSRINPHAEFYLFIDEIQLSYRVKTSQTDEKLVPPEDRDLLYTSFYDVLSDLMTLPNIDIYVTGSNSKLLSKDVATNFRDRGTEIKMYPLSFSEYYPVSGLEKADAFEQYMIYGGMPLSVLEQDDASRAKYLSELFRKVYIADVVERFGVDDAYAESIIDVLCSSVGSLTNPKKLSDTLNSTGHVRTSDKTVKKYLDIFEDAFLFEKAVRYDIKGKAYLSSPVKYYAEDVGLRNARLSFRQTEQTHLMENVIYIELMRRGYLADVGVVRHTENENGTLRNKQYEIDFVVERSGSRIYIQSAFAIPDEEKRRQEITPLMRTGDFFRKIVIVGGSQKPQQDETGITYVGIIPFLLDEHFAEG